MSYDIRLVDDKGETIYLPESHALRGGTYALGGTTEAWLNVTYNYSQFFHAALDAEKGIRWLYGRRARDCVAALEKAIAVLGTTTDDDYWRATPGNAGAALNNLLTLARLCPDGIFQGD